MRRKKKPYWYRVPGLRWLEIVHTILDPPELKYFPGRPWYDEQIQAVKK